MEKISRLTLVLAIVLTNLVSGCSGAGFHVDLPPQMALLSSAEGCQNLFEGEALAKVIAREFGQVGVLPEDLPTQTSYKRIAQAVFSDAIGGNPKSCQARFEFRKRPRFVIGMAPDSTFVVRIDTLESSEVCVGYGDYLSRSKETADRSGRPTHPERLSSLSDPNPIFSYAQDAQCFNQAGDLTGYRTVRYHPELPG